MAQPTVDQQVIGQLGVGQLGVGEKIDISLRDLLKGKTVEEKVVILDKLR